MSTVKAIIAWVASHKSELGAAGAFLSGVLLPGPWGVAAHAAGYFLTLVAGMKY